MLADITTENEQCITRLLAGPNIDTLNFQILHDTPKILFSRNISWRFTIFTTISPCFIHNMIQQVSSLNYFEVLL